jgi:hypothetical protein
VTQNHEAGVFRESVGRQVAASSRYGRNFVRVMGALSRGMGLPRSWEIFPEACVSLKDTNMKYASLT